MPFCALCKDWYFNRHTCPPIWETRDDNSYDVDEWHERYARNALEAAEKHGEEHDQGSDYSLLRGHSLNVEVRQKDTEKSEWFEVYGETVPQYHASSIPPPQTVLGTPSEAPNTESSPNPSAVADPEPGK